VRVTTTTDGGESFSTATVAEGEGVEASYPAIDRGGADPWLAWTDPDGTALVSRGTPADGFTEPVALKPSDGNATRDVPPDLHVHEGRLSVTWYRSLGDAQQPVDAQAPVDALPGGGPPVERVGSVSTGNPVTDVTETALDPDGARALPWTDPGTGLRVALADG
jgi:hypothetical protein